MANELTITGRVQYKKGNVEVDTGTVTIKVDVSGDNFVAGVASVATSQAAFPNATAGLAPAAEGGWCMVKNLDDANYVDFMTDDTDDTPMIRVKAGEFALFRISAGIGSGVLDAQANSAAVNVQYWIWDD